MRSRMRMPFLSKKNVLSMMTLALPLAGVALPGCGAAPDTGDESVGPGVPPGVEVDTPAVGQEVVEGRLEAVAHDDLIQKRHWTEYFLVTADGRKQKVDFGTARPALATGQTMRLMATRVGDALTVTPEGTPQDRGGVSPKFIAPVGAKRLAVILMKYVDDTDPHFTPATANGWIFSNPDSVANFYKETSFNKVTITGTVFDWATVPHTFSICEDAASVAEAAVEARPGVDLTTYDHVMFMAPGMADICGNSGFAQLPDDSTNKAGRYSWIRAESNGLMAHELGHNFGAGHANAWVCNEAGGTMRVALDVNANCFWDDYDDMFDPMGVGYHHFHGYNKWRLGYLPDANQTTWTADGEFTILPIEQNLSGLQSLRVPRTNSDPDGAFFYLDFRRPFGTYFDAFPSGDAVVNGVSIRLGNAGKTNGAQSSLVDSHPDTPDYPFDGDAPLQAGSAMFDPNDRFAFYVLSAGDSGARVRVLSNRNPIKINFQPASAQVPAGYLVDSGATYADRGNGQTYGWNVSNTANAVELNSAPGTPGADQRYDTFERTQAAGGGSVWELSVPNGTYLVRIGAGDNTTNAFYHTLVEGQTVLANAPVGGATWMHRSKVVTVSDGRLTVTNGQGAMNNKINFIEVVSLDIGGGTPPILSANFNSGTDSFTYADNTFRGAINGGYASGTRLSTGGASGSGGLQVSLGGVDSSTRNGISGGWKRTFSLAQGATITLNFDYNLTIANYESDEYGEVLASVDGILTGTGGNSEVARLTGGTASATTGWKASPTLVVGWFPAGSHTLTIGGYNNKKNASNETSDIRVDNVVLRKQ